MPGARSRPASGLSVLLPGILCAILLAILAGDAVRIGFFADDFLFLDAARRQPASEVLLGQHGIYPWYRPLSRELYFYAALVAGPWGRPITLALSFVTLLVATGALFAIGRSLASPRIAIGAALLFLAHEFTRFLTAWGSGFQDLSSIALVLLAVTLELRGRSGLALAAAFLAAFAKETGALAFVLLPAVQWITGRGLDRRRVLPVLGTAALALGIHLAVRATWAGGGASARIRFDPTRIASVTAEMLGSFLPAWQRPDAVVAGIAILAAGAAWMLVGTVSSRTAGGGVGPGERGALVLATVGAFLGLAPLVIGNLLGLSPAKAYYAFPAIPWICLLVATVLGRISIRVLQAGVAALLAWSVLGLHPRAPNLDSPEGWISARPGWREAVRLSAAAARFRADLGAMRDAIPRGSTVLYTGVPVGTFLVQGDDGATTRELLGDPTLRAGYLGDRRLLEPTGPKVLVEFDRRSLHLRRISPADPALLTRAAQELLLGDPLEAEAYARYARPGTPEFVGLRAHLAGATWLLRDGPPGLERAIRGRLWPDSNSTEVARIARLLDGGRSDIAVRAHARVLRRPLTDSSYVAAAESLLVAGAPLQAALYLRMRSVLREGDSSDRVVLGQVLSRMGMSRAAAEEYRLAIAAGSPVEGVAQARRLLAEPSTTLE